ncbi:MAG TPA: hypothetical protein ENG05_02615, partial [Acidilobales archaeon]|nr:hypothetical protein [Acidilobales archaeon]
MLYEDKVILREQITEIGFRDDSLEINKLSSEVLGMRKCFNGCWIIKSCQGCKNFSEIEWSPHLERLTKGFQCGGLAEAETYEGVVKLGSVDFDENETIELITGLCGEAKSLGVRRCEIVVTYLIQQRSVLRNNESKAEEHRSTVLIDIGLIRSYGAIPLFSGKFYATILWKFSDVLKAIELKYREALHDVTKTRRIQSLGLLMMGKMQVILDHEATAALIHEVSHLLDPTYDLGIKRTGLILAPPEFELIDDPFNTLSPTLRFFDDEGVKTFKRVLIESGRIVDLHHTRTTAFQYGSRPGSAYGLFHKPLPFHTTLVMREGDWKEDEILEDTKKGILIRGTSIALMEHGYVRIVPNTAYVIERGEVKDYVVKVKEVKIPLQSLRSISAISKTKKLRVSRE